MEINRLNVSDIIRLANLKADKDYGQNFLIEPEIAGKIVSFLNVDNDNILEIGPGLGSLTNFINNYQNLTLVDIDYRMIDFLKLNYKDNKIIFINNDIRKVDVSYFDRIIGNLPYNITTELVLFLLINAKSFKKMVLMCQSEAFFRFNDLAGENYGPASILLHLLGDIKKELIVKPGSFSPAPKCNSTVFSIVSNPKCSYEEACGTYKLSRSLFQLRRKTIANNFKSIIKEQNLINNLLKDLNINPLIRPENISYEKYLEIYRYMVKNCIIKI